MFDQAGFNQELKELAEKYGMMQNMRFVHRYHCEIRRGGKHCTCVGRHEFVLYRADMEAEELSRQAMLNIGEKR
jgi:hypothetical protein